MTEEAEYILGTDSAETRRLRFQHEVWVQQAHALWERAGLRGGDTVLDLGCGPGFTSFDLAHVVGSEGRVIACDESARFLEFLTAERERRGLAQVEPSHGAIEMLDLEPGSVDAAYARWLFCWVRDVEAALAPVARSLKPGGVVALQDYIDWGAMKLIPRSPIHDRAVEACMRSWHESEGTIDVGEILPAAAEACGLVVEHLRPIARTGRVGSLEWRWIGKFLHSYLPKLVKKGLFASEELDVFRAEWSHLSTERIGFCYTPVVVDIVLRKPS
ncbi:MAG: methyltransferase domain-containing protein [bacterium]|nr:methyltransferase domain-containing protein [bacterium]